MHKLRHFGLYWPFTRNHAYNMSIAMTIMDALILGFALFCVYYPTLRRIKLGRFYSDDKALLSIMCAILFL